LTATSPAVIVEEVAGKQLRKAGERRRSSSMRFLVTIDGSDMSLGRPPEQLAKVVE
jgi:hypothetical protein